MILEEYVFENTKIEVHDDGMVENVKMQKECIDSVLINLINKNFLL